MSFTLRELAAMIQGEVIGNADAVVSAITNTENPLPGCIAFIQHPKDLAKLEASAIAGLIVPKQIEASSKPVIRVDNPKLAWAQLLRVFHPARTFDRLVSKQALVSQTALLARNVTVEPFARIDDGAQIEEGSVIRSFAYVGCNVQLGAGCMLHPGVVIYENCVLGKNVTVHAGSVIGADGFGYVPSPMGQQKVPQVGNVIIEEDVEIGACTTIDRATIGSTVIGRGTKIDNQVQIAHNVSIGPHSAISAQTGISGSCKVGAHVTMGGKAGLGDHVEIGDWVMVGAGAGFPSNKKIPPKQIVFGQPARPYQEARRQIAAQLRSAETLDEVREIKKRLAFLEEKLSAKI